MPEHTPKHKLTRHSRGWVKKINRKTKWVCSFKVAETAAEADDYYERHFSRLWKDREELPGKTNLDDLRLSDIANGFIARKKSALDAGEITQRTYDEYCECVQAFLDSVGATRPVRGVIDDTMAFGRFRRECAAKFGPHRLAKFVIIIRSLFKWASAPPLRLPAPAYGSEFDLPSRATFRHHRRAKRAEHGPLIFTADEVKKLTKKASPTMRAMILLGLVGYGNTDLATLPASVVNLDTMVIDYARNKTGADRRVPLWPEHADAIAKVIALKRPAQPGRAGLLFRTRFGLAYVRGRKDQIGMQFSVLCKSAGVVQNGRNFYSLRRTFRTHADTAGDQRAAALIMGHDVGDVGGLYVQNITDERLRAVCDRVKKAVFPDGIPAARKEPKKKEPKPTKKS